MKVKVLEQDDTRLRLLIEETDPTTVNAVRRTLVADIPKMAIEDVEFHLGPIRGEDGKEYESVAPLFDEVIAHRLGMVPIPTDGKLFVPRSECKDCDGEGCPNCTIIYSLNKRGPAVVTSGDLEPIGDASLKPRDPGIPIVKLGDGQAILVYATAILGRGREHAKWQVAQGVGYRYLPVVKAGNKDVDPLSAETPLCQAHVPQATTGETVVKLSSDCDACRVLAKAYKTESLKVSSDPTRIVFHFETDGSMTARDTLFSALDILEKRFGEVAGKVEALE